MDGRTPNQGPPTRTLQDKLDSWKAIAAYVKRDVTTAQRWPETPDIPAISETIPGYEAAIWYGISAPKGTPPEIIAILNKAVNAALADPKLAARFKEIGAIPDPGTPEEFGKLIADETAKWRKVVEFAGISID